MSFGATPLDGSGTPIPLSSTVPDGSTTPVAVAGGPSYTDTGNTKAPVSIYVKDGNAVAMGTTTQTKATDGTTTSWSVIQLLKGIFNSLLNTLTVQTVAGTTGGSTPFHLISAASTNGNNVKASAGTLYGYTLSNTNASARYVRLYNLSGSPTVGTSTIKHTVQVPGNATVIHVFPIGMAFGTGIAVSATGLMADTDTTAISAGDLSIDLDYA